MDNLLTNYIDTLLDPKTTEDSKSEDNKCLYTICNVHGIQLAISNSEIDTIKQYSPHDMNIENDYKICKLESMVIPPDHPLRNVEETNTANSLIVLNNYPNKAISCHISAEQECIINTETIIKTGTECSRKWLLAITNDHKIIIVDPNHFEMFC